MLEALKEPAKHLRTQGAIGFRSKQGIEEALRIFRLVEVIVDATLVFLGEEIDLLLGGIDLRSKLFDFIFLMLEPQFDVVERSFQLGVAGRTEKFVEKSAAVETLA